MVFLWFLWFSYGLPNILAIYIYIYILVILVMKCGQLSDSDPELLTGWPLTSSLKAKMIRPVAGNS